jgi:hypothetical protein
VYAEGTDRRRPNVEGISLLVLDVDRVVAEQLEEICGRFGGYRHLIHTTHTDQSSSRSVRIITPLSRPVLREEWSLFWRAAKQLFEPRVDPACADVRRIYFLPTCPQDAEYGVQVNEGAVLDVEVVLATAPVADHVTSTAERALAL